MKDEKAKSLYDEMVEGLSVFVIRTADKDKIIPENRNKYKPYHIKCNKNTGGQEDDCRNNEQQWLHLPYLR